MTEKPLSVSRTQWTAQFLVAAELTRRGYAVAFTLGNQPGIDLVVTHLESGVQFFVDVKGNKNRNTWLVEREGKPDISSLYYILVSAAEERSKDEFFVLTQGEARKLRDKHKCERGGKGSLDPNGKFSGFPFNYPQRYGFQARWEKLPLHKTTDTEAARPTQLPDQALIDQAQSIA